MDFDDNWPPPTIKIRLDGNNQPWVSYVIHELLHVVLFTPCFYGRVDATVEEAMIVGLQKFMYDYVCAKKSRLLRWEQLIARKARETEEALELEVRR